MVWADLFYSMKVGWLFWTNGCPRRAGCNCWKWYIMCHWSHPSLSVQDVAVKEVAMEDLVDIWHLDCKSMLLAIIFSDVSMYCPFESCLCLVNSCDSAWDGWHRSHIITFAISEACTGTVINGNGVWVWVKVYRSLGWARWAKWCCVCQCLDHAMSWWDNLWAVQGT